MSCCNKSNIVTLYGYINGPCLVIDEGSKENSKEKLRKLCYGFQSCDDIELDICLNCGKVISDFPKTIQDVPIETGIEDGTYYEVYDLKENKNVET